MGDQIGDQAGGNATRVRRVHHSHELALKGEQVIPEATGIRRGRQANGLAQSRDDERRFRRPPPIDGGAAHAGSGGHAVDGETGVPLVEEDLQHGIEDGLVIARVAGPSGATRPRVVIAGIVASRVRGPGHHFLSSPVILHFILQSLA